ncbi:MAG: hypothetical protein KA954_01930 [Chitinophagales bacterium]|nr:hypothetical protein [Bacteroidota bacterium]MBP7398315.1 hypothetical protein [Chitinophagales bacterium]MBP8753472.1 hypothetical protein [Chitinophagales bacterium]MBP9548565.1 hypothetical protein [Chitinophagales bacterium]MBP9704149.1 hypothetical protein [Chitinophagales bacterium]
MKITITFILFSLVYGFASAANGSENKKSYESVITVLTDAQYPDNNSIGFRSNLVGSYAHNRIQFTEVSKGYYDITVYPGNAISDTIFLANINLIEMVPAAPAYLRADNYLTNLAILNQEWNRIQVRFNNSYYKLSGGGNEESVISRFDLANNCLSKGEWEMILYTKENNNDVLYYQCWFQFPEELYDAMFYEKNGIGINAYNDIIKNYKIEQSAQVNLDHVRTVNYEKEATFVNLNNELYPLKGERLTKAKNIVSPIEYTSINDFLNDNTKFATYASPGYYTRSDPRATYLSRFSDLTKVTYCKSISVNLKGSQSDELQLIFSNSDNSLTTRLIIGGLQIEKLPVLNIENMQKGWQQPMGFSNHSFYSDYQTILNNSASDNPYFAVLMDENNFWLDSHEIGIDGPLMFIDESDNTKLHVLLLSFERHAFVGHFVIDLTSI